MKKWEDRKQKRYRKLGEYKKLNFLLYMFSWQGRKVEGKKTFLFGLEENERIKNRVYINLPSYPN